MNYECRIGMESAHIVIFAKFWMKNRRWQAADLGLVVLGVGAVGRAGFEFAALRLWHVALAHRVVVANCVAWCELGESPMAMEGESDALFMINPKLNCVLITIIS